MTDQRHESAAGIMPRMDIGRLVLGLAVMVVGVGFIIGNRTLGRVGRKYGTANLLRPGLGERVYAEDAGGRVWQVILTGVAFVAFGTLIVGLSF
jgi:hypothetical protein